MSKILNWLKGKKTIITAVVYAIAAVLNETGVYAVPAFVFQVLASLGLITLRLGVKSES